jgi:hypothetical protein
MKFSDWRAAVLALVLALGTLIAWWSIGTPAPKPTTAPTTEFSAGRAMIDDRAMAAKPHPTGSAEAGLVRSYLMQRLQFLGLDARMVDGAAIETPRWFKSAAVGGNVENLVGILKGTEPSLPAIALMAHSDSVPGSPGAADDAAGVSTILEVVRALKATGPHKRDVVVLITDGEEAGLLGARAFFASGDPLLKHIGEVVNLEARGGGGRVAMFQTGDRDGAHIALFRGVVWNTSANSLTGEIYKSMPNDTDFTVSRAAGFPGYNFAFIGKEFDYHAPSSTPAALDQGSLQHMGDQALAITRALVDAEALPAKADNAVYFDGLGRTLVSYPAVVGGWLLFGFSLILGGVSVWWAQRRTAGHGVRIGPVVWGFLGSLIIVVWSGVILWAAHQLVGLSDPIRHRALLAQYPQFFWGFMLLTIGPALFLVGPVQRGHAWTLLVGKAENRWSHWAGATLPLVILALALQTMAPPTGSLWVWPLVSVAVLMAVIAFGANGRFEGPISLVAAAVIGVAFVAQNGATANFIFTAVGEMAPELLVLFVFLAIPVLFPLLTLWGRGGAATQLASIAIALLGAGLLTVAATHSPWTARLPRPVQAFYLQDAVTGKAWIASGLDVLDPWSAKALGGKPERRPVDALNGKFWLAPAPVGDSLPPQFTSTRDGDAVVVKVTPRAGGRELRLTLSSTAPVSDVTLNGRPTDLLAQPNKPSYVRWAAPGEGLMLRFTPKGKGELDLKYAEVKDGWPGVVLPPPKPADVAGIGLSDTTVLTHELKTRF